MIHTLHTKLTVRDLDRAIAFYQAAFGFTVRARRPGPDASEIAFLVLPSETTELQLSQRPGAPVDVPPGLVHLALRVDDMDTVCATALAAGATSLKAPYALPSGSVVAFLRDPDGYDLELVQKPAKP